MDKRYTITKANAYYTGGGIYLYMGALDNGEFFDTADEWEDVVLILSADPDAELNSHTYPDYDDCAFDEWVGEHITRTLTGEDAYTFWKAMLEACDMLETDKKIRLEQLDTIYKK